MPPRSYEIQTVRMTYSHTVISTYTATTTQLIDRTYDVSPLSFVRHLNRQILETM